MLNHVTNLIRFYGEQNEIKKLFDFVKSDKVDFDFEKLIPIPDEIYVLEEDEWCIWRRENWGTARNCCDVSTKGNTIKFKTSWNMPEPIMYKLIELFPNIDFEWLWADEDIGYNCGKYEYGDELVTEDIADNATNEAYEIYIECYGENNLLFKDENGNWNKHDLEG